MSLAMTAVEISALLAREFPQIDGQFTLEDLHAHKVGVRMHVSQQHLRPGGTVSGPSIFALADVAFYIAVLSRIGPVPLAVTTNCAIDFMRKPAAGRDLLCEARLLKLGRTLAVGDAMVFSAGQGAPVARASLTYSIPPDRQGAAGTPDAMG